MTRTCRRGADDADRLGGEYPPMTDERSFLLQRVQPAMTGPQYVRGSITGAGTFLGGAAG